MWMATMFVIYLFIGSARLCYKDKIRLAKNALYGILQLLLHRR